MNAFTSAENHLLLSALQYAEQGWNVLPITQNNKVPYLKGGYKIATCERSTLIEWWKERPQSNVAISTGYKSGILVLDIDPRNRGTESLRELIRLHGELPETCTVRTGGGGEHYYFKLPSNTEIKSRVLAPGIDLKADGGYVVAPPSTHPSGGVYEWENEPRREYLALAPNWLIEPPPEPSHQHAQPDGDASATPLGQLFAELGMLGKRLDDGKVAVVCPWHQEHTTGRDLDTSTVIFPSSAQDGLGGFHCSHSHCAKRSARDALKELRLRRASATAEESWRKSLRVNKEGIPRAWFRNICLILENDNAYTKNLRFDELHGKVLLRDDELTDSAIGRFRVDLDERYDMRASEADMVRAVQLVAEHNKFHPVRQYLQGLRWDGRHRIDQISSDILRARVTDGQEMALVSILVRRWCIGLVGRPLQPGLKVDTALILQGTQGTGKSTFFRTLAKDWFNDTEMNLDKDGMMLLAGAWISEWAELENVMGRNAVSRIKAFLSSTEDRFRPPFGRTPITVKRSSVVVGTTNLDSFLHDPTGSRRFWVIPVGPIDITAVREQREQLLAEAVHLFRSGERHWLSPDEEETRSAFANRFADIDPWEEPVLAYAQKQTFVRLADVLSDVLAIETSRQDRRSQQRVADILRRAGWSSTQRRKNGKPTRMWLPPVGGTCGTVGR